MALCEGFSHIVLPVSDLDRSEAFYRDIFGFTDEVHDYVTEICRHAPDRLLPCGGVDPVHSKDLAADARRVIEHYKVKMLKVHGPHTLYSPDDYLRDKPGLADVE